MRGRKQLIIGSAAVSTEEIRPPARVSSCEIRRASGVQIAPSRRREQKGVEVGKPVEAMWCKVVWALKASEGFCCQLQLVQSRGGGHSQSGCSGDYEPTSDAREGRDDGGAVGALRECVTRIPES